MMNQQLPGLPRDQRNAIAARAYERFRDMPIVDIPLFDFDQMEVGNLYVITFQYTGRLFPPVSLGEEALLAYFAGGFPQDRVLVSVVKIVCKLTCDEVEVELEQPVCMSCRDGPMLESDRFALHRNGHVRYFISGKTTKDWVSSMKPQWQYTMFPVLPVVVSGCSSSSSDPSGSSTAVGQMVVRSGVKRVRE